MVEFQAQLCFILSSASMATLLNHLTLSMKLLPVPFKPPFSGKFLEILTVLVLG